MKIIPSIEKRKGRLLASFIEQLKTLFQNKKPQTTVS